MEGEPRVPRSEYERIRAGMKRLGCFARERDGVTEFRRSGDENVYYLKPNGDLSVTTFLAPTLRVPATELRLAILEMVKG